MITAVQDQKAAGQGFLFRLYQAIAAKREADRATEPVESARPCWAEGLKREDALRAIEARFLIR